MLTRGVANNSKVMSNPAGCLGLLTEGWLGWRSSQKLEATFELWGKSQMSVLLNMLDCQNLSVGPFLNFLWDEYLITAVSQEPRRSRAAHGGQ